MNKRITLTTEIPNKEEVLATLEQLIDKVMESATEVRDYILEYSDELDEDGYTVGLVGGNLAEPLMGTFTDFEELLYALAPVVQDNVQDAFEFGMFSSAFYMNFADSTSLSNDEVAEILLK